MQWRSGKAAGLTACKQQAERQSRALKFSLIPLKEGVWGIKGKKKKKLPLNKAGSKDFTKD